MTTKNLQAELPLPRRRQLVAIDPAAIQRLPSALAAIRLCVEYGGFQYDKEIYKPLHVDAGNWTRMKHGEMPFPFEKVKPLMDLCGNEAPLLWLAHQQGKGMHPLEDEKDRVIREQREEIVQLRQELRTLVKYGVLPAAKEGGE